MSHVVVGCRNCENLWIATDLRRRETAECPRCAQSFSSSKLRSFATADSFEEAAEVRSRILADRAGYLNEYRESGHFGEQEDQVAESLPETGDCQSSQDVFEEHQSRYQEYAERLLNEENQYHKKAAKSHFKSRYSPSTTPKTIFDEIRDLYAELAEERLEAAVTPEDDMEITGDGQFTLTEQVPARVDAEVDLVGQSPTEAISSVIADLQNAVLCSVFEGAEGKTPTEFQDTLFALDVDTESKGPAEHGIRWLVRRAVSWDWRAMRQLRDILQLPGTGQIPHADVKNLTELLKLGSSTPTVAVQLESEFFEQRRGQREALCDFLTTLAEAVDVQVIAGEKLQRAFYKNHREQLPVEAEDIIPRVSGPVAERAAEGLARFEPDGLRVDILRVLSDEESGTRSYSSLYSEFDTHDRSTLSDYFGDLEDVGLVERYGPQATKHLEIRPAGKVLVQRFDREVGRQVSLDTAVVTPQNRTQYVSNPSDGKGPTEESAAATGGGLVQTAALNRRDYAATVASAPDAGIGLVDHDIRRREDGREGAVWCDSEEDRLVVSAEYWNPTQYLVSNALALTDWRVWEWLLTPARLDEENVDLAAIRDIGGLGWCKRGDSYEDFISRLRETAREELFDLTREYRQAKDDGDEETLSEVAGALCRKASGLGSVVAALCQFANVELIREIRVPDFARNFCKSHVEKRDSLITTIAKLATRDSFYGGFTAWKQLYEPRSDKRCFATPTVRADNPYGELTGSIVLVGPGVSTFQSDLEHGLTNPGELHDDAPEFATPLTVEDRTDCREAAEEATRRMCHSKGISMTEDAVSLLQAIARTPHAITQALHWLASEEDTPGRPIRPDEVRYALREGLAPDEVLPDATSTVSAVVHALLDAEKPLSQSQLAEAADVSTQSIRNNRDLLEAVGLLEVEEQGPGKATLWRLPISFESERTESITPAVLDAGPVDTLYEVGLVVVDDSSQLADPDDALGAALYWPPDPDDVLRHLPLGPPWERVLRVFTLGEEAEQSTPEPVLIGPEPRQSSIDDTRRTVAD